MLESSYILVREARKDDLPALVALFAADALGGHGDTTDPAAFPDYARAFAVIEASPDQTLYVAEYGGEVVGTFQTMVTTSLTGRGSSAMIIEAVQTRAGDRCRDDRIRHCRGKRPRFKAGAVNLECTAQGRPSFL